MIYLLAGVFFLVFVAGVLSQKPLVRRLAAIIFFIIIAIGATLFFETGVRIVLEDAHRSGELTDGFVLGVQRLTGWFTWGRIVVVLSALGLLIIALRKPPD